MSNRFSLAPLLEDVGDIIGGLPGTIVRYAARIIREQERFNHLVAERIDQEQRTMTAAGLAAHLAARAAGLSSQGSGAR